ncbi:putative clathrin assembly protein At4g40080 [Trifolium pratense]|uniref:putative clathrin assembly protein At4g40080 n=1 Tax=Trifolium pratense TaxID=57577 RepID=UPI001E697C69|nr:putative clathrin assembly protein At4g40080 [Trifolium pratense]
MAKQKKLKTLTNNLKDKASVIYALLSIKRHVSSIQLNILRATSHTLSSPPSDSQITAVLTTANTSHTLPRACINSLMDRLHRTKNSTVALKCLFTLHNITIKGSFILKDQLSCYPSYGGYNFLNLSTFRDDSDFESVQLSSWVRWYATIVEQILTVSRILGYYLNTNTSTNSTKDKDFVLGLRLSSLSNADLLYKIECLVVFVEQVSDVPESLELQRNELVYEIVRMVGEDYRKVQGEILFRLEELGRRIEEDFDVGELNELVSYLKRLEESKENLVLLFVNRRKNNGFWELIKEIKMKGLKKKEEIEGKWITVVVNSSNTVVTELTRFTNPFLEPGQYLQVPPNFATVR